MQVKMICRTTTSGVPWEYNVHSAFKDESLVLEMAGKYAKQFAGVPWFMGMDVWSIADTDHKCDRHIGFVSIETESKVHIQRS